MGLWTNHRLGLRKEGGTKLMVHSGTSSDWELWNPLSKIDFEVSAKMTTKLLTGVSLSKTTYNI